MWWAVIGTALITFSVGFVAGVWFVLSDADGDKR